MKISDRDPVRISEGLITDHHDRVEVSWEVSGLTASRLWFAVQPEFGDFVEDACDAAVVALVIPAMQAGKDIEVEGAMSARLLWGLTNQAMPILRIQLPDLAEIEIRAAEDRKSVKRVDRGVATGLSNGVDSLNTVLDHVLDPSIPEALRVTHFLFNDVGSHGRGDVRALAAQRRHRIALTAADLGVPLITTSSNIRDFHTLPFGTIHTFLNTAVPLALQRGLRRFLYSSGVPFDRIEVTETDLFDQADPMFLQALSTEGLESIPVGTRYSRVEKTERIVDMPLARHRLDVCWREGSNCSTCHKCLRTLVTIEATGHLEDFAHVFDLAAYRSIRGRYISYVIASGGTIDRNAIAYAREHGTGPKPVDYLRALALRTYNWGRLNTPAGLRSRFRHRVNPFVKKTLRW